MRRGRFGECNAWIEGYARDCSALLGVAADDLTTSLIFPQQINRPFPSRRVFKKLHLKPRRARKFLDLYLGLRLDWCWNYTCCYYIGLICRIGTFKSWTYSKIYRTLTWASLSMDSIYPRLCKPRLFRLP